MAAIIAMCSPLIAKMCIVPEYMNGLATSPLSDVRQPSVIAQSRRTVSSSMPSGPARVLRPQRWKRTDSGSAGGLASSRSRQSLGVLVRN